MPRHESKVHAKNAANKAKRNCGGGYNVGRVYQCKDCKGWHYQGSAGNLTRE